MCLPRHKQWRSLLDIWSYKCKFFCVYRPYKESISEEMNNDYDLNLHLHDQSRALRLNASRWSLSKFIVLKHFG